MEIRIIKENKKDFLDLLLLADEQESMIDKYLERGELFALYDGDLKSVCVVTEESDDVCELKNIATYEQYHGKGYGSMLLRHVLSAYKGRYGTMLVGTGDVPKALRFYERHGFEISHRVKNFFTDNVDHPMFEDGVQLVDMVYLKQNLLDLDAMIAGLYGKDTAAAYETLKELEAISDESSLLYPYISSFIEMLKSDKYVVRVRGFRLLCKQAKWDEGNKIDEELYIILRAIQDEKPTAVRQALQYLRFVVPYKKELREKIKQAVCSIDYSKYKDTMQPLIAKDVQCLLRDIDGL